MEKTNQGWLALYAPVEVTLGDQKNDTAQEGQKGTDKSADDRRVQVVGWSRNEGADHIASSLKSESRSGETEGDLDGVPEGEVHVTPRNRGTVVEPWPDVILRLAR